MRRFCTYFAAYISFLLPLLAPGVVRAATLTALTLTLSSDAVDNVNTSYTVSFTTDTTSDLDRIDLRFSTTSGGSTIPDGLSLGGASLGALTGLGGGWTLNTSQAGSGILYIANTTPENVLSGTAITIPLTGITNGHVDSCDDGNLSDTCWFKTQTKLSGAVVDESSIMYTIIEDPALSLTVEGVAAGETHNGITTTATSTPTTLPFGITTVGEVKYATHKLTINTNAPNGYTVYARLIDPITAMPMNGAYNAQVYPFGATNATWSTPQLWTSPTGTTANNNTAWLGANTTDTRVTGWTGSANKFGPISVIEHPVAFSTGDERTDKVVYVSYAFGVSSLQASSTYIGGVLYRIVPIY